MKPYVSIDLETTGVEPSWCQILEVGAVIDDGVTPLDKLPVFHCYIDHPKIAGQPTGLAMNAAILERIGKCEEGYNYYAPGMVAQKLWTFLFEHGLSDSEFIERDTGLGGIQIEVRRKSVQAAGKNFGSFDLQFLKQLPKFANWLAFKHRSIDPGCIYFDPSRDDGPPDLQTCLDRAGIIKSVSHNAVEDAFDVVRLIRAFAEI